MKLNKLTSEEKRVIIDKNTEPPFSGKYDNFYKDGIYICKQCNSPLFTSSEKFKSGCGWPSFDDHFPKSVKRLPDADGVRIEIVCAKCGGHLGHVFEDEGYTPKTPGTALILCQLSLLPKTERYIHKINT